MTKPLAAEMQAEVDDVLRRVSQEVQHPQVLRVLHYGRASMTVTASLGTELIPKSDQP